MILNELVYLWLQSLYTFTTWYAHQLLQWQNLLINAPKQTTMADKTNNSYISLDMSDRRKQNNKVCHGSCTKWIRAQRQQLAYEAWNELQLKPTTPNQYYIIGKKYHSGLGQLIIRNLEKIGFNTTKNYTFTDNSFFNINFENSCKPEIYLPPISLEKRKLPHD
jgi:hypothetical protein